LTGSLYDLVFRLLGGRPREKIHQKNPIAIRDEIVYDPPTPASQKGPGHGHPVRTPGDQRPIIRRRSGFMEMDNTTFGLTMLICGMGGTLLTLWIMSLVMTALGRLFPEKAEPKKEG
jgi:hypothetical protein